MISTQYQCIWNLDLELEVLGKKTWSMLMHLWNNKNYKVAQLNSFFIVGYSSPQMKHLTYKHVEDDSVAGGTGNRPHLLKYNSQHLQSVTRILLDNNY